MLTAIVFIIILGILIFVHELGHFLVAVKNGIKAEEFGFGFPPRILGVQILRDEKKSGKRRIRYIWGNREIKRESEGNLKGKDSTIYSINWIPLGGFVRIKGEDGGHTKEKDSFSSKPAWVRIKVLSAGVAMNFLLAWFLLFLALLIGSPQAIEDGNSVVRGAKIQVSQVIPGTPAEHMGLKPGDEIVRCIGENRQCEDKFYNISQVQEYISNNKGVEIILLIKRGNKELILNGVPRVDYPSNEGALGISLAKTAVVSYPWYEAVVKSFTITVDIIVLIFKTLFEIIKSLFTAEKVAIDVSGPVGIAYLAKQVTELGFVHILHFAALLSINLGIINGLPFPALDGGRIIFVVIEKIKGSPVSHKIEQVVHTAGFVFLILLMVVVTLRDILKFEIIGKIGNYF